MMNSIQMNDLMDAVTALKTREECKKFFRDLCTLRELESMTSRWQVAKQVKKGIPYRNIVKKTGASTATITRVASWVHHGTGGYQLMLERKKRAHAA